jgi:G:T-mismatch repair DNA endonuclease (very short patch repair protein)
MKKLLNIFYYLTRADYPGSYYIQKIYYYMRYSFTRVKILLYCKWNGYPVSNIFLTIPLEKLWLTEFTKNGQRDISSKNVYKIIGKVIGGDWDKNRTPIDEWPIYISLEKYFKNNIDLKRTPYYTNGKLPKNRKGIWHAIDKGKYSREIERNTRLYELLKENGYKTQKELGNVDYLDEIRVKIARDGTFLWENSIHRFVLARIIDLSKITVVVTVRHSEWVSLKKKLIELSQMKNVKNSNEKNKVYSHPDLEAIPYTSEGEILINEHIRHHISEHENNSVVTE